MLVSIRGITDQIVDVTEYRPVGGHSGCGKPITAECARFHTDDGWVHWIKVHHHQRGYEPFSHDGRCRVRPPRPQTLALFGQSSADVFPAPSRGLARVVLRAPRSVWTGPCSGGTQRKDETRHQLLYASGRLATQRPFQPACRRRSPRNSESKPDVYSPVFSRHPAERHHRSTG